MAKDTRVIACDGPARADQNQIIVPTSSIDIPTVFERVLRLTDAAGLLSEREKSQVSLL